MDIGLIFDSYVSKATRRVGLLNLFSRNTIHGQTSTVKVGRSSIVGRFFLKKQHLERFLGITEIILKLHFLYNIHLKQVGVDYMCSIMLINIHIVIVGRHEG